MDFRKVVFAFVAIALIGGAFGLALLSAQPAALRAGQEVRAHNDSLHTVISGRVFRVSARVLELIRSPDSPPTTIHWTDIHRLEVKAGGVWTPLALVRGPELLGDSTAAAGALAGAAAGRTATEVSYFWPAFLASAPLGFFGPFAFCSDCEHHPKFIAGGSIVASVVVSGRARASAKELPTGREVEIQHKPAAYQAAYREAYTAALSDKLQKQVVGGSFVGLLAGFVGLLVVFTATYGSD